MTDIEAPTPAATGARKGEGPMDKETLRSTLHGVISAAVNFVDTELTPVRAQAADYYKGEKLGNEEDGRSQFVVTEVRDGIQGVLPSVLRTIFGAERAVEFIPPGETTADALKMAREATDAVQFLFTEECGGFLRTHAVLKDGLVKRTGIFKWGREECPRVKFLRGVKQEELEAYLGQHEEAEVIHVVEHADGSQDAEIKLPPEEKLRVWAVPPEEFLFDRNARDEQTALFLGHRTRKSRGDLIALGVDPKVIDEHGGTDNSLDQNIEKILRAPGEMTAEEAETAAGEANEGVQYVEAYVLLDVRGTGTATRYKICTIGPNFWPVTEPEPVDCAPFAVFIPDPEPHTLNGQSWADRLMDLQRAKSMLLRCTLDSYALSIYPRTAYVEGQVAVEDVLNTEIGAPIRMHAPGMVTPFTHSFQGREGYPLLDYFDTIAERRTGQNRGAMGIDADALQSTTKGAVEAAVSSSQEHKELLARIFCEMAMKPLFRGLLRELRKMAPAARTVRYRDQVVNIDPAAWDDMDVQVNVAIGQGTIEQRVVTLTALAAFQKEVLATLGPGNPLVTIGQLRNTIARILELQGVRDVSTFLNEVPADWKPPEGPPQPSPEMALVEIEAQKAQAQSQAKVQELQIKLQQAQTDAQIKAETEQQKLQIERERLAMDKERMQQEFTLKAQELELKYQIQLRGADLEDARERDRMSMDAQMREREMAQQREAGDADRAANAAVQMHKTETGAAVQREGTAVKADVAREGQQLKQEQSGAESAAPTKRRRVKILRDADGRLAGLEEDGD